MVCSLNHFPPHVHWTWSLNCSQMLILFARRADKQNRNSHSSWRHFTQHYSTIPSYWGHECIRILPATEKYIFFTKRLKWWEKRSGTFKKSAKLSWIQSECRSFVNRNEGGDGRESGHVWTVLKFDYWRVLESAEKVWRWVILGEETQVTEKKA